MCVNTHIQNKGGHADGKYPTMENSEIHHKMVASQACAAHPPDATHPEVVVLTKTREQIVP